MERGSLRPQHVSRLQPRWRQRRRRRRRQPCWLVDSVTRCPFTPPVPTSHTPHHSQLFPYRSWRLSYKPEKLPERPPKLNGGAPTSQTRSGVTAGDIGREVFRQNRRLGSADANRGLKLDWYGCGASQGTQLGEMLHRAKQPRAYPPRSSGTVRLETRRAPTARESRRIPPIWFYLSIKAASDFSRFYFIDSGTL